MKATLAIATTKKLGEMQPDQLFKLAHGDESKAVLAVLSVDTSGTPKPAWDSSSESSERQMRVVVIASLRSPDDIGYRPTGAVLSVSPDFQVIPVEQITPCSFREACLIS